jgi:preprotein translocase subunit SecG
MEVAMLSFLREQDPEDSLVPKPPEAAGKRPADDIQQTQEQEYLTVATKGKQVRKTTILLAVLFGIGLLSLWFMIKKSAPQTAAASVGTEEEQIEMAITRLTGVRSEIFGRMDEVVEKFYEFSDVQQVQVDELAKNPFELEMFLDNVEETSDTEEGSSDIEDERMRQQRVRRQAKNMQLLSIMQSDQGNCCMIDDRILYDGDSIRGFKVCQISESFVKLESEGVEVVLKLSQ